MGSTGASKKMRQESEDSNAAGVAQENKIDRAVSKSSALYENSQWDLADAAKDDGKAIEKAKDEELPKEMRGMSIQQKKDYVAKKSGERSSIQKEIQDLSVKRQQHIDANTPKAEKDAMLDAAMMKSIKEKGRTKNLNWEK